MSDRTGRPVCADYRRKAVARARPTRETVPRNPTTDMLVTTARYLGFSEGEYLRAVRRRMQT